jgi:hypothetical protein
MQGMTNQQHSKLVAGTGRQKAEGKKVSTLSFFN